MKTNPEYETAPFELGWVDKNGKIVEDPWPRRFNSTPPDNVWQDTDKFYDWLKHHEIQPLIP